MGFRGWRRWTLRVLLLLALLAISTVLAALLALRGSLPQLEGQGLLPGLQATVQVQRDALGVVSITADNQADMARALGYVHAQERYFEMDLARRSAAGDGTCESRDKAEDDDPELADLPGLSPDDLLYAAEAPPPHRARATPRPLAPESPGGTQDPPACCSSS